MTSVFITVDAKEVYDALEIASNLTKFLRPPTQTAMEGLKAIQQTYPPPRGYDRTFDLKNSWTLQTFATGDILGHVKSTGVAYNHYVQSRESQAWMHKGYWTNTVEDTIEKEAKAICDVYDEYLNGLFK